MKEVRGDRREKENRKKIKRERIQWLECREWMRWTARRRNGIKGGNKKRKRINVKTGEIN